MSSRKRFNSTERPELQSSVIIEELPDDEGEVELREAAARGAASSAAVHDQVTGLPSALQGVVSDVLRLYTSATAPEAREIIKTRFSRHLTYESNAVLLFSRDSLAALSTLTRVALWVLPPPTVHGLRITTVDTLDAHPAQGGGPQVRVALLYGLRWQLCPDWLAAVVARVRYACGVDTDHHHSSPTHGNGGGARGGGGNGGGCGGGNGGGAGGRSGGSGASASSRRSTSFDTAVQTVMMVSLERQRITRLSDRATALYWLPPWLKVWSNAPALLLSTLLGIY